MLAGLASLCARYLGGLGINNDVLRGLGSYWEATRNPYRPVPERMVDWVHAVAVTAGAMQ